MSKRSPTIVLVDGFLGWTDCSSALVFPWFVPLVVAFSAFLATGASEATAWFSTTPGTSLGPARSIFRALLFMRTRALIRSPNLNSSVTSVLYVASI